MRKRPGRPRKRDAQPAAGTEPSELVAVGTTGDSSDHADTSDPAVTDPATATGGHAEPVAGTEPDTGTGVAAAGQRKRGRPAGSGKKQVPIDISGVEKLLIGIHTTLLIATGIPEMEIDAADAKSIALAYADVAEFYPAFKIEPKFAAILTLCGAVGGVYGTRIISYRMRVSAERAARPRGGIMPPTAPPQPSAETAPPPVQSQAVAAELRTGEIPGIGKVEFPPDHPQVQGHKRH